MKTKTKLKQIRTKQVKAELELEQLQAECEHPNRLVKYGANTGNWCASDDSYWIDIFCPDCEKMWTVDQDFIGNRYGKYERVGKYEKNKDFPPRIGRSIREQLVKQ